MSKRLARKPADFPSVFLRMEELILASSGADVFDEACRLVTAQLFAETGNPALLTIIEDPGQSALDPVVLQHCRELLAQFCLSQAGESLDALFETLITHTSKGQKGQFFTPRYVVDFCIALAAPAPNEIVVDPACGSGAFLNSAREAGVKFVRGYDIDRRAVLIARLRIAARGGDPQSIQVADSLRVPNGTLADVVLTNPPFAGEILDRKLLGEFELASGRNRIERDVLFLERCIKMLRPGGRLAIVLPHSKFAGAATRYIRAWLLEKTDVLAVIGLGRHTFLPHTHQKANVLLARKRTTPRNGSTTAIFFAQSARDGKNSRGQLTGLCDLSEIASRYRNEPATARSAMLDGDLTLAPERHSRATSRDAGAIRIDDIADIPSDYVRTGEPGPFVSLDTTNAAEGFISNRALHVSQNIQSRKKRLLPGDVIISRLRPYLRQVAFVDRELFDRFRGAQICCSTEFYVFRARDPRSLAFLVPFLLGPAVQAQLAQAQEGGHHPRVPSLVITQTSVPARVAKERDALSDAFCSVVATFRSAEAERDKLVNLASADP
ncbi:MAG: N-6 DNA methylase [Candidatus Eremiobacteraeota bacterium]|nr:N-6 DNA methylase [Candidatus Eremiobacteraeota bacterium]